MQTPIDQIVADFINRYNLTNTSGVVAVSGGPDSVALAHLLVGQRGLQRLVLAHVNHQLRGDESDADEAFVQSLSQQWQTGDRVHCRTTRIDVAALAKAEGANLESIARRERYRWLAEVAKVEGAAWVATGHTADDQAETVLFRMIRGSGVTGLAGMSARRPLTEGVDLVRPLLSIRRQELHAYLHDRQIPYRVDSSNQYLRYTRNRLRLELLPVLQQHYNPAIVETLCQLAEQSQELAAVVGSKADTLLAQAELPRAGNMLVFSMSRLQTATPNLIREMFRRVWQREGWPMGQMDFASWNRLAEIAGGKATAWDFPGQIHARARGAVVQLRKNNTDESVANH